MLDTLTVEGVKINVQDDTGPSPACTRHDGQAGLVLICHYALHCCAGSEHHDCQHC